MHLLSFDKIVIISLLASDALGFSIPFLTKPQHDESPEKRYLEQRRAKAELEGRFYNHRNEKRLQCVEDDLLQDVLNAPYDAEDFCRSYIGIQTATASKTVIARKLVPS